MLLADLSIPIVLISIGVLTVLITMLVCMIKMSRELEDVNNAMTSIARTLINIRKDLNEIDTNAVANIEAATGNPQSEIRPRDDHRRQDRSENRNRSQDRWQSRAHELQPHGFQYEHSPVEVDQIEILTDDATRRDELGLDGVEAVQIEPPEFDFESIDRSEPTLAEPLLDAIPVPPPIPEPKAGKTFLDAAAGVGESPRSDEDDIVVDEGDDGEIVYI
jgi:hypothetical protein